jgi:transglutaminase superfamily protein
MSTDIMDSGNVATAATPISAWRIAQLLVAIAAVKVALVTIGFARTRRALDRGTATNLVPPRLEASVVESAAMHVAVAAAFFPGRALCLEQSLVLHHVLRRRGLPVRFCLGVRTHRFAAHAWVECRGAPINEPGEVVRRLAVLPDV